MDSGIDIAAMGQAWIAESDTLFTDLTVKEQIRVLAAIEYFDADNVYEIVSMFLTDEEDIDDVSLIDLVYEVPAASAALHFFPV